MGTNQITSTTPNAKEDPVSNPNSGIETRVANTVEIALEKPFRILFPYLYVSFRSRGHHENKILFT